MELTGISPTIKTEKVQVKKAESSTVPKADKVDMPTDRVVLSSGSLDVQKVRDILAQTPEVRADKVKALKEQIARGEYKIDPAKLADKMMTSLISETLA
ncbi:MAG TPA: flagellar biosynthesis anti-sigma factor FlgM [Desulfobulbaceae bacterium]|nr:MAG: flagellar biosynthesis anti-sigma factor FlgM [Deltaproteobacteria bacterium RIFOXYD12_FULL_53_23]HCC54038.1 flagellar biosynthesis anti-sigma factor FlgM [Desulfobulbaceae bacterium]